MDSVAHHHAKPTKKQLSLLHMVYRFRFVTTDLAARYQGSGTTTNMYRRLSILAEQGYIGRKFERSYRLRGQHASYYLLPTGLKALKQHSSFEYEAKVLHNIYRDRTASDQFIEQSLTLMRAYCDLKTQYGDRLQFFTKSDLAAYEHFPQPLPHAYLRLSEGDGIKEYFLDVHQEARPFFIASRRVKQYADYADGGDWAKTGTDLPEILALCDTQTLQKRMLKRVEKEKHPELRFLVSTKEELAKIIDDARIWKRNQAELPEALA